MSERPEYWTSANNKVHKMATEERTAQWNKIMGRIYFYAACDVIMPHNAVAATEEEFQKNPCEHCLNGPPGVKPRWECPECGGSETRLGSSVEGPIRTADCSRLRCVNCGELLR